MLSKIKNDIVSCIGTRVNIIYNGSRNKIERFSGVIVETYDSIFVVELDCGLKKSFSYSDLLIGVISINN